ncbi:MAG TPA: NADH-quinone oxidoreductase subunit L [Bacteroidales bacterium]|nr:NADH-quinone oxidoreductase subunit L [Bacteroidales bacterium]
MVTHDITMIKLAWLIPLFPLTGFLVTGLGYRHLRGKLGGWIASSAVLASFILSVALITEFLRGAAPASLSLFNWIPAGTSSFSAELLIDRLSVFMLLIITGVGFLIHVYSIGYMQHDGGFNRFFSFMNLFLFFMTVLVMGGSYLVMFIGWEGVGLCSYLLIGFWYRDHKNNDAARKAFIMNRIGDLGFILGMFLIFFTFGSLSFNRVFGEASRLTAGTPVIAAITLLLFAGATGKSAQIPLLTWLPDAMAGPTPVSALIHAATMVTAGVYMVARSNILYALSPSSMIVVASAGLLTSLFAALIALFQNDIKKVLAYSTISQLGLMFLALGIGAFSSAMFHLMTHAFFKALLFLAAGSIIHSLGGIQDLRQMGGLKKYMPLTYGVFLAGALSISGIPPFSGFFSKDEILLGLYKLNPALWAIGLLISLLTAFYTFRIFYLSFSGSFRTKKVNEQQVHESPAVMTIPMVVLAIFATIGGFAGLPEIAWKNGLGQFLKPVFSGSESILSVTIQPDTSMTIVLMVSAVVVVLTSIFAAWYLFVRNSKVPSGSDIAQGSLERAIRNKLYLDEIYDSLFTNPLDKISRFLHEKVDSRIIDKCVESAGSLVLKAGEKIRLLQTGNVGFYLFAMVICILAVLFFSIFLK